VKKEESSQTHTRVHLWNNVRKQKYLITFFCDVVFLLTYTYYISLVCVLVVIEQKKNKLMPFVNVIQNQFSFSYPQIYPLEWNYYASINFWCC